MFFIIYHLSFKPFHLPLRFPDHLRRGIIHSVSLGTLEDLVSSRLKTRVFLRRLQSVTSLILKKRLTLPTHCPSLRQDESQTNLVKPTTQFLRSVSCRSLFVPVVHFLLIPLRPLSTIMSHQLTEVPLHH